MDTQNQGLTVGELTIAIAILIIAGFIWSNIGKDKNYDQSLRINSNQISLSQTPDESFFLC